MSTHPSGDPVLVRVSPEILEQLAAGPSQAVIVLGIDDQGDGTYDMTLRAVDQDLTKLHRYESALRTIRGPDDRGPWIEVYRKAGGGYEGLQAVAEAALATAFDEPAPASPSPLGEEGRAA